jgi:GT2 family glycosyltransferase
MKALANEESTQTNNSDGEPLIYIVILNWNAAVVTAECLQSLRSLTYSNYRIILVDNGSSDNSGEILATHFPEVHLLQMESNRGFTGGCNAGMREALENDADYILLLNNDTTVAPDVLEQLAATADMDETIAIVSPKILFADAPDRIWYAAGSYNWWQGAPSYNYKRRDSRSPGYPQAITFATGCAMLLRVEALKKVGLFDERFFAYGEDIDLTARMLKAGYRAMYVPNARVWHKASHTSKRQLGFPYAVRLSIRNELLLMTKHTTSWQRPIFLLIFFARRILYFILLGFWKKDLRISWATIAGSYDFLRGSYLSSDSPKLESP